MTVPAGTAPARLDFLDGLRGLAALQVVLLHYASAFLPAAAFAWPAASHPTAPAWQPAFANSKLFFIINGYSAVAIFFVMSGYVLRLAFAAPGSLAFAGWRRLLRIGLPTAAAVGIAALLLAIWPHAHRAAAAVSGSTSWLGALMATPPRLAFILRDALLYSTVLGYEEASVAHRWLSLPPITAAFDPPVWTMNIELAGSLLCIGLAAIARHGRWPLAAASALLVAWLQGSPLTLFVFGFWLAELPARPRALLGLACLAAGIWFASRSAPPLLLALYRWLRDPHTAQATHLANELAGLLIFLAVLHLRPLQALLAARLPRWLGRHSFSLYLLHFPVLASIGSLVFLRLAPRFGNSPAAFAALAAGLLLTLPAAALFTRFVDRPSIRLSRRRPWPPAPLHPSRQSG